mmetsp:Transcript_17965/g.33290  ORF Transcript_17965/g.33290 Transcript_17965/m.33290 type:complete len:356 (-) Transcript_17965:115-1182(-)
MKQLVMPSHVISSLLYATLGIIFLSGMARNLGFLSVFTSTESSCQKTTIQDRTPAEGLNTRTVFQSIELIRLVGTGTVSWGFEARLDGKTVMAKVAADHFLYYSDIEIDAFRILKTSPSIPNIPEFHYSIRSMPNPFKNRTYLQDDLGLSKSEAENLSEKRRVSVQVMDFVRSENRKPETLREVRTLLKSLLSALAFAHSRNVMHCDMHSRNYHFDGNMVSLFDWNGAFLYAKDQVLIHQPHAPTHLFPPEAWKNTSAVHASVSAFDVYSVGRLTKKLLKGCCGILPVKSAEDSSTNTSTTTHESGRRTNSSSYDKEVALSLDLMELMLTADPYQRPNTTQLLNHPFFLEDRVSN